MDEWSKSQNVSSEQTDRTEPQPPPQAQTEQVNAVFTRSGKSDDSLKTQKDSPPPIIVNNKIRKDKPIKTAKRDYQMCTYGLCCLFWNIDTGIKLYEWAGNLVAPELVFDHHLLDRNKKESIESESHKSSTHHSSVNEFVVINIPEEDVKPKQIILDPNDLPMRESVKTVAPTPNSVIIQLDVDDNFVINSTHLKMILENKFHGYLRVDPHDHIREFLAICDMFKYGETQSEAVKFLIFPIPYPIKLKPGLTNLMKSV
ncbi:hypothetical protein Tco_0259751 [Tanacetum coccineum]